MMESEPRVRENGNETNEKALDQRLFPMVLKREISRETFRR